MSMNPSYEPGVKGSSRAKSRETIADHVIVFISVLDLPDQVMLSC